jgi:chromatin remodeling complex protein RSC6
VSLQKEFSIDLEPLREQINEVINDAILQRLDREKNKQDDAEEDNTAKSTRTEGESEGEPEIEDELDDEAIARRLQEEENSRARGRRAKTKLPKVKAKRISRPTGSTGFNQPFLLSKPLSRLLDGTTELSRPQVVKQIWAYIKANDLQDPSDRRSIVCDEKLLAVFKKPRLSCFGMNKVLSDHLMKKSDVIDGPSSSKSVKAEVESDIDLSDDFDNSK